MVNQLPTGQGSSLWYEIKSFIFIGIIALFIRTFIMEPFFVPTGSMKQTILENDYIFATKYSYGYSKYSFLFITPHFIKGRILESKPDRGDIIIFKSTHDNMDKRYIKRLIGLPGDKVQMISGVLYINDVPVGREFVGNITGEDGSVYKKYIETLPNGLKYSAYYIPEDKKRKFDMLDNTKVFNIPEGHYFFIGDNRNESNDSRLDIGFVPYENLIAKSQFLLFSTEKLLWLNNVSIKTQIAQIYYWIDSIRWHRLFHNVYGL